MSMRSRLSPALKIAGSYLVIAVLIAATAALPLGWLAATSPLVSAASTSALARDADARGVINRERILEQHAQMRTPRIADAALLAEEALECDRVLLHLGDDDVPVPGGVLLADDHEVPVRDVRLDHRVTAHAQHVAPARAPQMISNAAPDTRWAREVVEEMAAFPVGEHDDYVDSVSLALMRFRRGGYIRTLLDEDEEQQFFRRRNQPYY